MELVTLTFKGLGCPLPGEDVRRLARTLRGLDRSFVASRLLGRLASESERDLPLGLSPAEARDILVALDVISASERLSRPISQLRQGLLDLIPPRSAG